MDITITKPDGTNAVVGQKDISIEAVRAERAIDSAVEHYEREKAKLYRSEGTPIYSPDEMKERQDALLASVESVVDEAKTLAVKLREEADLDMASVNVDPITQLSGEELGRANQMAVFVREDLERLRPEGLEQRLQTVIAGADRVSWFLYHRYAKQLLDDTVSSGMRGDANAVATVSLNNAQTERAGILRRAVAELAEKLVDPAVKTKVERAEEKRHRAMQLRRYAVRRLQEADGTEARAREEGLRRMAAMF